MPVAFAVYMQYVRSLSFDEDPDYRYLHSLFAAGYKSTSGHIGSVVGDLLDLPATIHGAHPMPDWAELPPTAFRGLRVLLEDNFAALSGANLTAGRDSRPPSTISQSGVLEEPREGGTAEGEVSCVLGRRCGPTGEKVSALEQSQE